MKHSTLKWLVMSMLLCVGVGAWAEDIEITTFDASEVVSGTTYSAYSNSYWSISVGGNNKSVGFNGTAGNAKKITDNLGTAANIDYYGSVVKSLTKIENVSKIKLSYTGVGAGTSGKIYLAYSLDNSTWNAITLTSGSQGASISSPMTFEFATIASAYYGIIFEKGSTTGMFRWDGVEIVFAKPGKQSCVDVSTMTIDPEAIDIKTNKTGTFSATATKNDAGATYSYSTTALSGLSVESDGSYTASATGAYTVKVTATPSDTENYSEATKSFDITVSDTREACGLEYETTAYAATIGSAFVTPVLTNPNSLTVTYSSSDEDVATVNETTGAITLLAEGSTTITASTEGNAEYQGGSATYTLTVTDPNKITLDFSKIDFSDWSNTYEEHTVEYTVATVKFASADNNTSTITDIPVTKGNDVELILKPGQMMKSVTFTCRQWGTKAQTITLNYSTDGGESYTSTGVTSTNFTISKAALPDCTDAVKITFSSQSNQVGIESATIVLVDKVSADIASVGYGTMYYGKVALEVPEGVTAKTYKMSGDNLTESVTYNAGDVIPAGEAVVLSGTAGAKTFAVSTTATAKDSNNALKGTDAAATTTGGTKYYALSLDENDENVGFYWMAADGAAFTNGAHKAYLALGSAGAKSFYYFNDASAIADIESESQIVRDGVIYNLAGQRLNSLQRGINIVNGKKVLVK